MLNERKRAAAPIAKSINEVENSLNATMKHMGELMSNIANARMVPGTRMPLTAGMDASEKLLDAATSVTQTYRTVVEAHADLAQDQVDIGLKAVSWGEMECPPMADAEEQPAPQLRAV
ncbi:MAG: hypothetical protein AAGM33_01010 [Pseudomonadota bacterium]